MNTVWESRAKKNLGLDAPTTESLPPPTPMPALMWRWLEGRGISTHEQIQKFLSPKLTALRPPMALKDMDRAVARLLVAFERQESVCIYGDYDLDGSSGIALLVAGLKGLGFEHVSFYQPSRFLEGYGINKDALKVIVDRGARLIVSVDCGITALEEAEECRRLGLDLIVTDHHLPRPEGLPVCSAVVNPNRPDCTSGLSFLSGVGVGFYLLMGLRQAMRQEGFKFREDFDLKSLLDLFAIGTVGDMVGLRDENRVLLKHGIQRLSNTQRPGLQALIEVLDLTGRDLDSQDIGFTIAPKLNALSRLELGLRPLDVLMSESLAEAREKAHEVLELNKQRRSLQQELEAKILAQIQEDSPLYVLAAEGHPGVVGLVATKVNQLTGRPALIVAWSGEEGIGSARAAPGVDLPALLRAAEPLLERYGGHAQAAGFSLPRKNFEPFVTTLLEAFKTQHPLGYDPKFSLVYDAEAELADFNHELMAWLKHAGPFGPDNPVPLFCVRNARIRSLQWLKDLHLKIEIEDHSRFQEAIGFNCRNKFEPAVGHKVDLLVEPSWNYWNGKRRLQLLIRDLRVLINHQ